MPMLPRFTLKHNKRTGGWDLNDETGETLKSFSTKAQAIASARKNRQAWDRSDTQRGRHAAAGTYLSAFSRSAKLTRVGK
jgi:hypothetical protein